MSVFTTAAAGVFADPNYGLDAVYKAGGVGAGVAVRVIRVQAQDVVTAIAGLSLVSTGEMFDIRQSEIANPAENDTLTIDSTVYIVQGAPKLDQAKGTWRLDTHP